MKSRALCWASLLYVVFFAPVEKVFSQTRPVLELPTLDPSGNLNLRVRGDPGTNYTIDASVDLTSWWRLFSGVASNGAASFQYPPDASSGHRYFRARVDPPLPSVDVVVGQEDAPAALGLVTENEGGIISYTNTEGVIYRLTVPTNAVVAPRVFTMTVVTNLGGLPFAAGLLAGVTLEPTGLELLEPAQMEFIFPTNKTVDALSASGSAFDGDGRDLRLTPTLLNPDRVSVLIFSLSGVGCSVTTLPEIQQQARRHLPGVSPDSATQNLRRTRGKIRAVVPSLPARLPFLAKCRSDQERRAEAIKTQLLLAETVFLEDQLAQIKAGANASAGKYAYPYFDFVNANISPYEQEAEGNCALTDVLAQGGVFLNHVADSFNIPLSFSDPVLCRGTVNCLQEISECCGLDPSDPTGADRDLRWVQVDAGNLQCPFSAQAVQAVQSACRLKWDGTMNFTETRHAETNMISDTEVRSQYLDYKVTVTFRPLDLKPVTRGDGTHALNGTIIGQIAGTYRSVDHDENLNCCGEGCYTDFDEESAIARQFIAALNLSWSPDTNKSCISCSVGFATGTNYILTNISSIHNVSVNSVRKDGDCFKTTSDRPRSGTQAFTVMLLVPTFDSALLQVLYAATGAQVTASESGTDSGVHGKFDVNETQSGIAHTVHADWDFSAQ